MSTLVRNILAACSEEESMQRFQNPPIEVRSDVKRPFFFIRPYVRVMNSEGKFKPKRPPYRLGYCDETTMRQAKAEAQQIMAPINAGRTMLVSQLPFGEVLSTYERDAIPLLGPAARITYARHIRLHIRPCFETLRLCDMDRLAVRAWLAQREKLNYSHNMLIDLRKVLSAVFSWAKEMQLWTGENPCSRVKTGGWKAEGNKKLPSSDCLMRFLSVIVDCAVISAEGARLIVMLAVSTGMRISEILGLQVRDIDPIAETVRIERRWARGNVGPTKTEDSRRVRQIPGLAFDLVAYARGGGKEGSDFIFGRAGVPPDDRDLQQHVFKPAARLANVYTPGFGMHRFRHLNITWRTEVGATDIEAMKCAGHTSLSMSWKYRHVNAERERAQVMAILDRLKPKARAAVQ